MNKKMYKYGNLFDIVVCKNCFSYRINQHPNQVFHGINSSNLDEQTKPIILPKGNPEIPYYFDYLSKRSLHIGPLYITGLLSKDTDLLFGFDINELAKKYPTIKYMDYDIWEILAFHTHSQSKRQLKKMRNRLFLSEYSLEPKTEILLEQLDCNLAEVIIAKTQEVKERAKEFCEKNIESILFEDSEQFNEDYFNHINLKCNCGIGNW